MCVVVECLCYLLIDKRREKLERVGEVWDFVSFRRWNIIKAADFLVAEWPSPRITDTFNQSFSDIQLTCPKVNYHIQYFLFPRFDFRFIIGRRQAKTTAQLSSGNGDKGKQQTSTPSIPPY